MIRSRVTEIRLEAGDVLLIQGPPEDLQALRNNPDVLIMEWSAADLPATHHIRTAGLIFALAFLAVGLRLRRLPFTQDRVREAAAQG